MVKAQEGLTLRIVYDGAPLAGKTASVRALAKGVGQAATTPAEENGRTLFFDWLEYSGGRFEGAPIRCEIVTVPGQDHLASRREALLRSADSVLFVVDSSPSGLEPTARALRRCRSWLDESERPAPIVFQANKRDSEGAASVPRLRGLLDVSDDEVVVETQADAGRGIREAFVHAVRLALRSTRAHGGEATVRDRETADGLLKKVAVGLTTVEADAIQAARTNDRREESEVVLRSGLEPLGDVAQGLVWPPLKGRDYLREARSESVTWARSDDERIVLGFGDHWMFANQERFVSGGLSAARGALLELARRHQTIHRVWDDRRCLVVLPSQSEGWSLWQLARRVPSVRDLADRLIWSNRDAEDSVRQLFLLWVRVRNLESVVQTASSHFQVGLENIPAHEDVSNLVGLCLDREADQPLDLRRQLSGVLDRLAERLTPRRLLDSLGLLRAEPSEQLDFRAWVLGRLERRRPPGLPPEASPLSPDPFRR